MDVCSHRLLFGIFMVAVILLGSISYLATVANSISIEKDWVVVIADKNSNTLAGELTLCSVCLYSYSNGILVIRYCQNYCSI